MKIKQNYLINKIAIFTLALISLLATSYALAWTEVESGLTNPKEGTVIDIQTGKPIANAWVIVRWLHGGFQWLVENSGSGECMHSLTLRTDENGVYHIPDVSKEVTVERSWSLLSKDRYSWTLVVFAPGYFTHSDYPAWRGPQKDYYTEQEIDALVRSFSPAKLEHPKVESGGQFGSDQIIAPIKVERSKLPPQVEVSYLFDFQGVEGAAECSQGYLLNVDKGLSRALYERAYKVACVNTSTYEGAGWELSRLWMYVMPPSDERERRGEAISKLIHKAQTQRDNNHNLIFIYEDRKAMCELTTPIERE